MAASLLISLWLVPFVLQYLSRPAYGMYAIVTDLLGWLAVSNLGVAAVFNSSGAQLLGKRDFEELNKVASTTFFAQLFSTVFIFFIGAMVVRYPQLLFGQAPAGQDIGLFIALLVAGFTVDYIAQPLNALLIADKQLHIDHYLKFSLLLVRTGLIIVLIVNGFQLLSIGIASFFSSLVISIITWVRVKKTLPEVKIQWKYWRSNRLKILLKNGVWFTIGGIAGILIFRMDSFLIGRYLSLGTVASFVITQKLYQIAATFHQHFFNTARPYFAQAFGNGEEHKLSALYHLCFHTAFASAFGAGALIFLLNKWFIGWWVGPDFYLGDTISLLLCIHFILQSAVLPHRILLATTLYKTDWHNATRIAEGLAKCAVAVAFVHFWGIHGIILGGIVASVLFSNIVLNYLATDFFKQGAWGRPLLVLLVLALPFLLVSSDWVIRIAILMGLFLLLFLLVLPEIKRGYRKVRLIYAPQPSTTT